ncbi:hypothetical protein CAPTEDRAFT_196439 [Capitella teleta]|uniref:Uncharacterized protein n=1 Tax=Capitella teleta TaxID=283909 RepID=R7VDA2_CAPTE|nr:hypothetical protein CAPTEDRAFT_196439 [Capitella teleta]|eukprot:ELU16547.1 hypothetical protein CAPTEDRAFT_196439 [Capitella teleta]
MVDFSIRVGNTSDVDKHAECARYDREAVKQGGDVTLDCSARGRYVSFRREGGDAIDLVTICEFIVIGHPLTTEDCPAGRTGTFCLDACEAGSFGVGCSEKCDENCKNDLCSADDGRCSNGCELWFAGDKCQDELRNPSIGGIRPSVAQLNVSAVSVTWTQDAKIPEKYAQYFGYRVYYAVGSFAFGGSTLGPTVAHDAAKRDQSLVVSNISAYKQYAFKVVPYRQIGGGRQYGFGSEAANIQLTTTAAAIPETATTPTSSSTASSNIKTTTKASKTVLPTDPNQTTKQNKFLHVIDPN